MLTTELHTTQTVTNLSVAMYMLSMSIFPLWWSSFSEQFGRRSIYLISFALFVVFAVLCAVSTSIAMLIVFRILTGGASASVQAVGAGTIADIWESRERGRAMSIFYLGPLLGPLIAPIVGGALAQALGWQATQYFLAVYGFVIWLLLVFLLPETLAKRRIDEPGPQELRRMTTAESAKVKTKMLAGGLKRVFIDPLSVLLFLRFPPVLITVLVAAIAFGALFVANISIQQKFSHPALQLPAARRRLAVHSLGAGLLHRVALWRPLDRQHHGQGSQEGEPLRRARKTDLPARGPHAGEHVDRQHPVSLEPAAVWMDAAVRHHVDRAVHRGLYLWRVLDASVCTSFPCPLLFSSLLSLRITRYI